MIRRSVCSLLLIAFSILGCARGALAPQAASADPNEKQSKGWLSSELELALEGKAGKLEVRALQAGVAGDRIMATVTLEVGACGLFVARPSAGIADLGLFLFGEDGSILGSDETGSREPAVLLCPPHPRTVYAVARIGSGEGLVAVVTREVRAGQEAAVRGLLTNRSVQEAAGVTPKGWATVDAQVAAHRQRVQGDWREARRVVLPVEPTVPTLVTVQVPSNGCLDVLLVPQKGLDFLDLAILDPGGRQVARGAGQGATRWAVLCSAESQPATLRIEPFLGRGTVLLVTAELEGGRRSDLDPAVRVVELVPQKPLDPLKAELDAELSGLGYGKPVWQTEGQLSVGERQSLEIPLKPSCFRLDILADFPIQQLSAWLWEKRTTLLLRREGYRTINLLGCSANGLRLDLETTSRPGRFYAAVRQEQNFDKALLQQPLAASRLVMALLERGRLRLTKELSPVAPLTLSATELSAMDPVEIAQGSCLEVTAALGPGANGLEVRLLDRSTNQQLAIGRGARTASAIACASTDRGGEPVEAVAELRVEVGTGTALVTSTVVPLRP